MAGLESLAEGHPRRTLATGDVLLVDAPAGALFVLLDGALRIEKGGAPIAIVADRGACVGEMSLLLGVPATADVVADRPSVVAVIEDAERLIEHDRELALALARLLASRLQMMTSCWGPCCRAAGAAASSGRSAIPTPGTRSARPR